MELLCKGDGLYATKFHNATQSAINKRGHYVSGTLSSARGVSHLLTPQCISWT